MLTIKLKEGKGNCTNCIFLNKTERNCGRPNQIKTECTKKAESPLFRRYFIFVLKPKRF